MTAKTLAKARSASWDVIVDAAVKRNPSRRAKTLRVTSLSRGSQLTATVGGATVASALGLRSTWFSVGVLSLQPPSPNPAVHSGTRVTLDRRRPRRDRGSSCRRSVAGGAVDAASLRRPRPAPFQFTRQAKG